METLKRHLESRKTAIISILEQPRREYNVETFHKLRVELKKLNAIFDLIDFCSKDFKRKKTFKPFHTIFRQAGKVRELQIEEGIVQNYCDDDCLQDYQRELQLQQLREELNYFLIVNKKSISKLNKKFKLIESFIAKVKEKKSHVYLDKKSNKIKKPLSKKAIPPKKIHELRKLVKLLIYNTDGLFTEKDDSFSEKKELAELLGQWHDLRVIIRRLNDVKKTRGLNPQEINNLEAIRTELKWESELLFSEINLAIPKDQAEISQ